MSNEIINPYQTFYDDSGIPLANGTISFLVNTTTTLGTIYSDEALTVAQANPYTLDAYGRIIGDVKYTGLRTLLIKTELGATVRTIDNVATMFDRDTLDLDYTKNFATLALAVADTGLEDGDALNIKERTSGNGGGGKWDVVLSSTVTENTYNIVQCTGVGTLSLVLMSINSVDVSQIGAVGDGATDDSAAINYAITMQSGKTLTFGANTYELGSTKIQCDNPITIICQPDTVFNQSGNVAMFEIDDTTDVTFIGNKCKFKHYRGAAGVNTFYIRGSERVKVENVRFKDSPKDQIYVSNSIVTAANTSKDVIIKDCDFDGARRQGISVIVGERLHIEGNTFHDVSGEAPQAGIDLEAGIGEDAEGLVVNNVSIIGNKFYDITAQSGLYIATGSNVTVQGNNFDNCLVGINATGVFVNTTEKTVSAVANASDEFTVTAHNMVVGDLLFFTTTGGGTIPTGATTGTTYRVSNVIDSNTLKFSTYYQSVLLSISDDGTLPLQVRAYREDRLNNIVIQGNTFNNMLNQSIIADQCNSMVIQGNVVKGGSPTTADMLLSWCDDGIIDSNIITKTQDGEGIFCSGIRTTISNNFIRGSTGSDQGIRFYGGEASKIINNTLIDCGNVSNQAMDIRYFNNGIISGNRIWDESNVVVTTAIDMNSTDCIGNIIADNNLKDSCASNGGSLSALDRNNIISNTNVLNDGETYSAHLRASSTNLTDISHQVNIGDKYDGKQLYNTTTGLPMYATGSSAGDTWLTAAGGGTITPV